MTAKECQLFDFRKAGYIDESLSRQIRQWAVRAAKLFQERWHDLAPTEIGVVPPQPVTQPFATFLDSFQAPTIGCPLQFPSQNLATMLAVSQADLLALILEILCDTPETKPEARVLTPVETELSQLVLETFANAISEAWPEKETLPFQLGELDFMPHRSRMYTGNEFMVVVNFSIQALAGAVLVQWAMPRATMATALAPFIEKQNDQGTHHPREAVQNIPLEVVFSLGKAQLSMSELTQLSVGDIVILDQRIDEPIAGLIDDNPIYKGWPGRMGADQVFKISRIIT